MRDLPVTLSATMDASGKTVWKAIVALNDEWGGAGKFVCIGTGPDVKSAIDACAAQLETWWKNR